MSSPGTAPPPPSWRHLEPQVLTDERLLADRASQLIAIRLLLAATMIVVPLVASTFFYLPQLDVQTLVVVGIAIATQAFATRPIIRAARNSESEQRGRKLLKAVTYGSVMLDYVALTIVVWLVGGARSPFLAFFLLHAIVSGVMLGRRSALGLHAFAYLLLSGIVLVEWSGVAAAPHVLDSGVGVTGPLGTAYALSIIAAFGVLFVLTGFILTSFSASVRRGERELRAAHAELRRLSEMRRDFLDIALHNLQSPVAAARLHMSNVLAELGGPVTDKQRQWLQRADTRLERLADTVRALQMLAALESINLVDRTAAVSVRQLLTEIVADHQDLANGRGVELVMGDTPDDLNVQGLEMLLREAITNYVTNALRYVPAGGRAVLRAEIRDGQVRIEVVDNGPGIEKADCDRLFNEFVRVRKGGRAVAKLRGSGLGLTIVRRIAELHGGTAGVESQPGVGSTFWVTLPTPP